MMSTVCAVTGDAPISRAELHDAKHPLLMTFRSDRPAACCHSIQSTINGSGSRMITPLTLADTGRDRNHVGLLRLVEFERR